MIFIDSNVPMYLVGAAHPNKVLAQRVLETWIAQDERLVTDVEVLQEILHRYVAIARREAILPAFEALTGIVDEVFPVDRRDVERAKDIVLSTERLSADALLLPLWHDTASSGSSVSMKALTGFQGLLA